MTLHSRVYLTFIFSLPTFLSFAQLPDTEIYLAEISKTGSEWNFSSAENITNRIGYDNQPSFSPDGKSLLFVQVVDSIQSDIYKYSFKEKSTQRVTSSIESEYSPTYTPDRTKISIVRVDQDSAQRFYTFDPIKPSQVNAVEGSDSIGYFCWLNDSLLAMFIVGEKHSLQILNTHTHKRNFVSYDIGRCLKLSADKKSLLYLDKSDSTKWMIMSMRISDFGISPATEAISGSEDFSPLPDGTLIMGSEGKLFSWKKSEEAKWKMLKDYSASMGTFYRITVNADASRIAFVAYAGKKP